MLHKPEHQRIPLIKKHKHATSVTTTNGKYMSYFWIFVALQAIFGLLKYGPFSVDNCRIIEANFTDSCTSYPVYVSQCGLYGLLLFLIIFCACGQEQSICCQLCPKECCSCDHLLFPFTLLIIMGIFQLVIAVSYQPYYFWQVGVDMFGYTMWFLYAPIYISVLSCRDNNDNNHSLFMCHIIFAFIASFGIIWLLIIMIAEDFQFDLFNDNPFVFIQIILEGTLILEWIHVVLHGWVGHKELDEQDEQEEIDLRIKHHDIEEEEKKEEEEDDSKHKSDDSQNGDAQKDIKLEAAKQLKIYKQKLKDSNDKRGAMLSDLWFYLIFALDLGAVFVFDIWKTVINNDCSSYDITIDTDCPFYLWLGEAAILTIALIILMGLLCSKRDYVFVLEYHRLFFPIVLWVILMLIEWIYVFVVRKWYVLQIWVDFVGYIIFFHQALYAVQLRKYIVSASKIEDKGVVDILTTLLYGKKNNNIHFPSCQIRETIVCNSRLAIISLICVADLLLCIAVLILNFYRDIVIVQDAAKNIDFDTNVVEIIAFMQIIFENALLFEYIHVLLGGWMAPCACGSGNNKKQN